MLMGNLFARKANDTNGKMRIGRVKRQPESRFIVLQRYSKTKDLVPRRPIAGGRKNKSRIIVEGDRTHSDAHRN